MGKTTRHLLGALTVTTSMMTAAFMDLLGVLPHPAPVRGKESGDAAIVMEKIPQYWIADELPAAKDIQLQFHAERQEEILLRIALGEHAVSADRSNVTVNDLSEMEYARYQRAEKGLKALAYAAIAALANYGDTSKMPVDIPKLFDALGLEAFEGVVETADGKTFVSAERTREDHTFGVTTHFHISIAKPAKIIGSIQTAPYRDPAWLEEQGCRNGNDLGAVVD